MTMTEQSPSPTTERDPLALAMLAAWVGVDPDQLPATMRAHTCADTMARWKKVGEAAVAHVEAQLLTDIERMKAALEPFAREAAGWSPEKNGGHVFGDDARFGFDSRMTVGHLRAAAAALNPQPSEKQEPDNAR